MYYPELYSMQNSLHGADLQKKIQFSGLSVSPELWFGGLKATEESFAFSMETCWYGEKWPVVFDVDGKEGEPTVIQKAFHADPRLRLSRTGSKCGALGWEWPPANRATRKVSVNKKNIVPYRNVWRPQGVGGSLPHWKHLPALGWFQYRTAAATGEKHHLSWLGFPQVMQNAIKI